MRIPFSLVAALALGTALEAQPFFIGVRAGQSHSRQMVRFGSSCLQRFCSSNPMIPTGRRPSSPVSGISTTLELHELVAIESDLAFVERGMRDGINDLRLEYVELPVLLRLAVPITLKGPHVFVHTGFAPAREVSCWASRLQQQATIADDCDIWRGPHVDLGIVIGAGLLLRRPMYQITASYRRTSGRRNLAPDPTSQERFNRSSAVLLGFSARMK
jgi:hypothetical protein